MFLKIPPGYEKKFAKLNQDTNFAKDMKNLHDKLKERESLPNIITLDVFREFEPLFQINNNLSREDIDFLTEKYVKLVDFYKETQIIVSSVNPTIVLTLPSLFTPFRSLTINEKNASLVATNAAMASSNVPKYSSEAFSNMFRALSEEQKNNTAVVDTYKKNYVTYVTEFFSKYNRRPSDGIVHSDTEIISDKQDYKDVQTEWDSE